MNIGETKFVENQYKIEALPFSIRIVDVNTGREQLFSGLSWVNALLEFKAAGVRHSLKP